MIGRSVILRFESVVPLSKFSVFPFTFLTFIHRRIFSISEFLQLWITMSIKDVSLHQYSKTALPPVMIPPTQNNLKEMLQYSDFFECVHRRTTDSRNLFAPLKRIEAHDPTVIQHTYYTGGSTSFILRTHKMDTDSCISSSYHQCTCSREQRTICKV